jgi:uncharacterized protein (TIGR02266 family)
MSIRIREVRNITILDIEGNVDINSSEIVETVGWLVNSGKINIMLNLEGVGLVDYSGLSILAIAYKNVVNHKGRMKFIHVALPVIELFKVARLESLFEVYGSEEEGDNSFEEDEVGRLKLRRKFARLDIHINAKYKIMSDRKDSKAFTGEALNISGVGVYLYTPHIFPINSALELEFSLPNSPQPIRTAGRVVWHADDKLQQHSYPGMGVSFVSLSRDDEKKIVEFIEKNVTHRSGHSDEM